MFDNLKEFLELLDVNPIWPIIILVAEVISCHIPHVPIGKVKKSKDKDGNEILTIFKYKK